MNIFCSLKSLLLVLSLYKRGDSLGFLKDVRTRLLHGVNPPCKNTVSNANSTILHISDIDQGTLYQFVQIPAEVTAGAKVLVTKPG